ncbi:MAG TPA: UDP-N-acetylglucosamine--N-acetylmuramyl-(pentapeptide) pyrophosphoryl-undecaprenol N-acetylglucosamine transferase [Chlamydiales bacterium]|nr:UDP-N-acetylglucosamine--N-acetylmuramyl-(pentapeptide) pyrophosphoryl-undecaprenol N-acetylglucosamine transferase [Chlamydiales bacterium]
MGSKKIIIAAGGTGGHLYPAMQLGAALQKHSLLFAGFGLKASPFFEQKEFSFVEISSHPLRKGFFSACLKGLWQSLRLIHKWDPDIVVGFGSYHTFPLLLAAALLRRKIILFEANAVLGKVNRFFAGAAEEIAFQFPVPHRKQVLVSWLPWNEERKKRVPKEEALQFYGLEPRKKTVFVFGGSQGALFLNQMAPLLFSYFRKEVQVIHLTGGEIEDVKFSYELSSVSAFVGSFEKKMERAYSAADFVLSRSGAGTVAELIHFQLPSLLIPYPHAAEDHQRKNGEYLVANGAAYLLEQKEATLERMIEEFQLLLKNELEMKKRLQEKKEEKRVHFSERIGG